ncbi:MAG TPA: C39 family peptidase [Acidobacteriota bacterium]|nr:C39 family peptidase [Acidobacteriota bacterium]
MAIISPVRRIGAMGGLILLSCSLALGREIWLDVPFVRQSHEGCGSACIAMVLEYWNTSTRRPSSRREEELSIYRKLYSSAARGIRAESMERYLEEQGFRVFVFSGSWQDLQEHLSKGRPLIVCLKTPVPHYTVVAGIDTEQGVVLVNDPARRKLLKIKRATFERDWHGSGDWTLLALP